MKDTQLSTVDMRTFQRELGPRIRGEAHVSYEPDVNFFSGADIELAWFTLQGEGSGLGSAPHPPYGGPSGQFNRYGPPNDMYDMFSCGERTMDHIAHEFIASRTSADVARLCSPTMTQPNSVRGFSTTSPRSSCTFSLHPSSSISCPRPILSCSTSRHRSRVISRLHWLSSITSPRSAITHRRPSHSFIRVRHSIRLSRRSTTIRIVHQIVRQIVRPRAQRPQRDRHPPPCGTSSHIHHCLEHGGERD
ncbi:hypothetical protein PIB30_101686 [Stylosanthes scabra]|uniref:Uncharacterized protein n=1 Tax=Stylosanthes scabra TaxID=79078 RepID=A0ABU6QY42_9FABA|nr:hypothetical protein [Stylosanthes scabra]